MYAVVFKNIHHEELPLDFKTEHLVHFFFQSDNQSPHDQCIIWNTEI